MPFTQCYLPPSLKATDRYLLQRLKSNGRWRSLAWGPNLDVLIRHSKSAGMKAGDKIRGITNGTIYSDSKNPRRIVDLETNEIVWGLQD